MSHDSDLPPDESDAAPTEPFRVQRCPHCGGLTAVPLSLVTSRCVLCDQHIEITPPERDVSGGITDDARMSPA